MFNKYYQDELNYLRALGSEYAERHPQMASLLGAGARDPDVERLFQGFAFLTGRLHERLDDQFGQIAEGFLSVLWSRVLKPIPSMVMVQFDPDKRVLKKEHPLKAGLELHSRPQSWGQYKFQTCRPLTLCPFQLGDVQLKSRDDRWFLELVFDLNPGATLDATELESLPIYISSDDSRFVHGWYLWLTRYCRKARLISDTGDHSAEVSITPAGYDEEYALFPDSDDEIPGHRVLREYLVFPEQFHFFHVNGMKALRNLQVESRFTLEVDFGERIPTGPIRDIADKSFRLHCTPAINLFRTESRIKLDHSRSEYILRSDSIEIEYHEIYSVDEVLGQEHGVGGRRINYQPFYSSRLDPSQSNQSQPNYRLRHSDIQMKRHNISLKGRECFMSFEDPLESGDFLRPQSVSIIIDCMNRGGAATMKTGELCVPSEQVPAFASFSNLGEPTPCWEAPASGKSLWLLVSSFAMMRQSFADLENLKSVLLFHGRGESGSGATVTRLVDSIRDLTVTPRISVENGTPLRVLGINLEIDCETDQIPEFYMFGEVLGEFLRQMATINTRLECTLSFKNDQSWTLGWPGKAGTCAIL